MADLTFQQLEQLVAQAGGSPTQQEYLAGIAAGVESGGNPTAHNPTSTASGLWQELTTTWIGSGGGKYAPTAAQASPIDQAIVAVGQSVGGYQPWAPDLGGAYGAGGNAGNPQSPLAGSPVANYLKSIGATLPSGAAATPSTTPATTTALPGGSLDPLNWPGEIGGAIGSAGGSAVSSALLGVIDAITKPLKTFVEDAGLVVLGVIMLIVAIVLVAHGVGSSAGEPAPGTGAAAGAEGEAEEGEEHAEGREEGRETEQREQTREARETVHVEKVSEKGSRGGGGAGAGGKSNAPALESEGERGAKLAAETVGG